MLPCFGLLSVTVTLVTRSMQAFPQMLAGSRSPLCSPGVGCNQRWSIWQRPSGVRCDRSFSSQHLGDVVLPYRPIHLEMPVDHQHRPLWHLAGANPAVDRLPVAVNAFCELRNCKIFMLVL